LHLPVAGAALDHLGASLAAAAASVRAQERQLRDSPRFQTLLVTHGRATTALEATRLATAACVSSAAALGAAVDTEEAASAEARAALDARSGGLADAAPLIALKRALVVLRSDSHELNVRLGVASHALMQARLAAAERGTSSAKAVAAAAAASAASSGDDSADSAD